MTDKVYIFRLNLNLPKIVSKINNTVQICYKTEFYKIIKIMRKQIIIVVITISFLKSYSQIIFEKGYFINDSNQKIECLIKNIEWKNNPIEFEYKLSQNDSIKKATIQTVKEFRIYNDAKYVRVKINIDRSSDRLDKMSTSRKPNYKQEILFLKVLIEGQASLFLYIDGNLTRFFYKLNNSDIIQLVHKKFLENDIIRTNNYYKQQLLLQLKCNTIKLNDFNNLKYRRESLKRLFIKYNQCKNSNYINYDYKQKKNLFHLTIRPGLNYSSNFKIPNYWKSYGHRLGIEGEYILPYNKNKWSIIIEPTYQYYEYSEKIKNTNGNILIPKIDYKSIELPIGVRYYFYFNKNSKLFANIQYIFDFSFNSTFTITTQYNFSHYSIKTLNIKSGSNISLGIGYKFKNILETEIRYNTSRELLENYLYWSLKYNTISIIIGYTLF